MANELVMKAGTSFKQDPAGVIKALFFLLLGVLLIVAAYKFFKGFGKATELISEFGPSTEAEKLDTISTSVYQDGIKWLDDKNWAVALGKAGFRGKTIATDYVNRIHLTFSALQDAATKIWNAKWPFYISETEVYNAIAGLPTKAAVSLMALQFNTLFKDKVGFYPLSEFLGKYLKLPEMDTLTKLISKKPDL